MNTPEASRDSLVAIPLRLGGKALEILRVTHEELDSVAPPEIALVELDDEVFTIGGSGIEHFVARDGSPLLRPDEIDPTAITKSEVPDTITLALGVRSLAALETSRSRMDGWSPPPIGIVKFGTVYMLGGDLVADYVAQNGGRVIHSNEIDSKDGSDLRGENNFN